MNTPTRFPTGVGNVLPKHLLAQFGMPDPYSWHVLFDDFNWYNTTLWSLLGVGTPTAAILDQDGGVIELATSAVNGDSMRFEAANALFALPTNGEAVIYRAVLNLPALTSFKLVFGLSEKASSTTPNDGIFFQKLNGSNVLTLQSAVGGVTTAVGTIATFVAATFIDVGFVFDGLGNVTAFVGPRGQPVQVLPKTAISPTAVVLSPFFGILSSSATVKKVDVTAVFVGHQRPVLAS